MSVDMDKTTAAGVQTVINGNRLDTNALIDELFYLRALVSAAAGDEPNDDTPDAWRVHRLCRMATGRIDALADRFGNCLAGTYVPEDGCGAT